MGIFDKCPNALIRPFDECLKLVKLPEPKAHSKRCFAYYDREHRASSSKQRMKIQSKRISFKDRYDFCCRQSERQYYAKRYPNKIALIIERFKNEKFLEELDRELFIVPAEMTAGQLQNVIGKQLKKDLHCMPIYLLVNRNFLPSNSMTMAELAYKHSSDDGFASM
uniref:Microtubule-associated proteins 1A/1B light chain 3C n=1 Tax=Ascaris suum TaxID=6253 RepID=F1LD65_ASCSU